MIPLQIGLIAGWAHDADALKPLAETLSVRYSVRCAAVSEWVPDFPGGLTRWVQTFATGNVCLVGWSMGALVILDALSHGLLKNISAVALLSGMARFTVTDDYPHGWPASQLRAMKRGLASRPRETLLDFFKGVAYPQTSDDLAMRVDRASAQDVRVLSTGLGYLLDTDMRFGLETITQPTLCWHGAEDRIVPVGSAEWLSRALPHASLHIQAMAGHDGVRSHVSEVRDTILEFLSKQGL